MRATLLVSSLFVAAATFAATSGAGTALAQRPVMERVRPTAGPPGTRIQLVGRHLGYQSRVFLGDVELPVLERLPNRWTLEIPPGARSGQLLLRTAQGAYAGPAFRVSAARSNPSISGLEPDAAAPGAEVTIVGQSFSARIGDNRVTLAGRPVVVRAATPTALHVILPIEASSGTFEVRVAGSLEAAESPPFAVTVGTAITSVEPVRAPPGSEVTLRGTGFSDRSRDNSVSFAGRRVRVVRATPTALTVRLPRRTVGSGRFALSVRSGGEALSPEFEVAEPVAIAGFTPTAGPPGTDVTITGSGFGRDVRQVAVTLGGASVRVRRVTPEQVVVTTAAGAPTGPLTVTVGGLAATSREAFDTRSSLRVDELQPDHGVVGSQVTLRGQGFAPRAVDNVVTLGGVRLEVIAASPDGLRVRIAEAPSGPFEVRAHGDIARSPQPFVVVRPPVVASFVPDQGPPGTRVTLTGSGFGTSTRAVTATLGRQRLAIVSVRDGELVVEIPRGARSGTIEVRVGTQGTARTAAPFVVGRRLRVGELSPDRAMVGAELVIRGEGFPQGEFQATFTGPSRPIRVRRESPVELRVVVPAGATTGPVELILPTGARQNLGTFTLLATPEGVDITSVDPECAYAGCPAILRGYGFDSRSRSNRVEFRGAAIPVRRSTSTTLEITLPDNPGNGVFTVDVRRAGRGTSPPFYVQPRPR